MSETVKIYEGANAVRSSLGEYVILGQDSFVRDSVLGCHVQINRRNIIEEATIGAYSYTGANTTIKAADIGKFCCLSWNTSITGNEHDYSHLSSHPFTRLSSFGFVGSNEPLDKKHIQIGNDVWIGANTCILSGVKIGDGAIVGGGGVVTKDVPPYAIAVGNPTKIIKYRFSSEQIEVLLRIRWWDFPEEVIKKNITLFKKKLDDEVIREVERIATTVVRGEK